MSSRIVKFPNPEHLYLRNSQIKGAGKGLFTSRDIKRDEVICPFNGELLSERQITLRLNKGEDAYFVEAGDDVIMDSMKIDGMAKYANDAVGLVKSIFKNNALKIYFQKQRSHHI